MTAMNKVYFDEGMVEVVDPKEVVTSAGVVRVSGSPGFPADETRISIRISPRPSR
jgi:hypothetical protein